MAGTLFLVSTPIGNLGDVTLRALDVLRGASLVVAEDTRTTRKLLSAHGIRARLASLHARSSETRLGSIVDRLLAGDDVAYVTDAGSPAVSDPGAALVDRARNAGATVQVIPGPSALTAAVCASGLAASRLYFLGFLPRSTARRRTLLARAGAVEAALVIFESPRRTRLLLEDLQATLPDREVAVCRELTKVHEEVRRGLPAELLKRLEGEVRGEVTVVVAEGRRAKPPEEGSEGELLDRARELLEAGETGTGRLATRLADEAGVSRRKAYGALLAARDAPDEDDEGP